jgi:hypothetical protein
LGEHHPEQSESTMLAQSAGRRLMLAAGLIALLWAGVLWALG